MTTLTTYSRMLKQTGLTLTELHRISGVSLNTLRSLSSGRNLRPRQRTLERLADALRRHSSALASIADDLAPPDRSTRS